MINWHYIKHNEVNTLPKIGESVIVAINDEKGVRLQEAEYYSDSTYVFPVFVEFLWGIDYNLQSIYAWCNQWEYLPTNKNNQIIPNVLPNSGDFGWKYNKLNEDGNSYDWHFNYSTGTSEKKLRHTAAQLESFKQQAILEEIKSRLKDIEKEKTIQNYIVEQSRRYTNKEITKEEYEDLIDIDKIKRLFGFISILSYNGFCVFNPYAGFILQENIL